MHHTPDHEQFHVLTNSHFSINAIQLLRALLNKQAHTKYKSNGIPKSAIPFRISEQVSIQPTFLILRLKQVCEISNSTEPGTSWEANRSTASQEIPRILWCTKVHYREPQAPATWTYRESDKSSPRAPILFRYDPFKYATTALLQSFVDRASWYIRIIRTNKMHYFLLFYFNNKPLHVSSRLAAHHQEGRLCINSNWYVIRYVDWLLPAASQHNALLYQLLFTYGRSSW